MTTSQPLAEKRVSVLNCRSRSSFTAAIDLPLGSSPASFLPNHPPAAEPSAASLPPNGRWVKRRPAVSGPSPAPHSPLNDFFIKWSGARTRGSPPEGPFPLSLPLRPPTHPPLTRTGRVHFWRAFCSPSVYKGHYLAAPR